MSAPISVQQTIKIKKIVLLFVYIHLQANRRNPSVLIVHEFGIPISMKCNLH